MTQLKFLNQTLELVQQVAGRLHQVKCIVIAEITLIVADVVTSRDMKTKTLFMVYALIYGRIFFIGSAITLTISTHKFLHYCNMVDNLFVPMTSSNFGSTHRLLKQGQRLDKAFRVAYLVTFLAICAPCYGGEINKIFPWLNYIKKHYNIMYYEALAIQIFNLQVLAIVTQALLQASIITISNLIVQADVFAQEIKCNKILNVKGFFVKFDGSYQRKVSKELVEIYKKHLKFLKYIHEYRGCPHVRSVGLIILYGGLGVVSFTAACFLLLNSFQGILMSILLMITLSFYCWTIFDAAQILDDKFVEVYESLYNTSWYTWNTSNKKFYLLLLMRMQQPVQFCIAFNITINREYLTKYIKLSYILLTYLYKYHI